MHSILSAHEVVKIVKILTNTNLNSRGGIAKRAEEMARYCAEKDIPLVIIGVTKGEYKVMKNNSVTTYHLPLVIGDPSQVYSGMGNIDDLEKRLNPLLEQIKRVIEKERVDVVLSEGTYYVPWSLYVSALHMGLTRIILYAGILTKEEANVPEPRRTLFEQIESSFNRLDNFYIFPSNLTKIEVERMYGREITNAVVIPNGISKEFFEQSSKVEKNLNSIGFVGRSHPIKNIKFLIDLAYFIRSMDLGYNIFAVSSLEPKTRAPFVSQGINLIPGIFDSASLRDFYKQMLVIVSPSHFETYGNVPIEAIASGTPAIVSNKMGVSEVFERIGLSYLILDKMDVQNVISKIIEIGREGMNLNVQERLKTLQWSNIIQQYLVVCENI